MIHRFIIPHVQHQSITITCLLLKLSQIRIFLCSCLTKKAALKGALLLHMGFQECFQTTFQSSWIMGCDESRNFKITSELIFQNDLPILQLDPLESLCAARTSSSLVMWDPIDHPPTLNNGALVSLPLNPWGSC